MKRFFISLLVLLAFDMRKVSAQEFTAEGEVVYKIFYGVGGTVSYQLHKHFLIKRSGAQWFIQTSNENDKYRRLSLDNRYSV